MWLVIVGNFQVIYGATFMPTRVGGPKTMPRIMHPTWSKVPPGERIRKNSNNTQRFLNLNYSLSCNRFDSFVEFSIASFSNTQIASGCFIRLPPDEKRGSILSNREYTEVHSVQ